MSDVIAPPGGVVDVDPFSEDSLREPIRVDTLIRETAPVVRVTPHGVWFTGRYDLVEQVFRDPAGYESSAGTGLTNIKREPNWRKPSVILENDPPGHTKYRRVMTSVLSKRVVRRLTAEFQQAADELVETLVGRGEFDAATDLAQAFPMTVLPDALGFDPDGRKHLLPYANLNFQAMGPRNELYRRAAAQAVEATEYVSWQMRREALAPDRLGRAIYAFADSGEIDEDEAAMLVRTFLSAGIDTTVFGIQFAILGLLRHPVVWRALRDDPGLAGAVFDEAMRWNSSSPFIGRTTTASTELGGVPIGAGEKVILAVAAANRDPRRWRDPEVFDLDRGAVGHLAFGTGIHGCVGQMMARMEATCVLSALARKIDTIEPAGEPVPFLSNWLRGFEYLPMRVTPR